jgi:hypothetical protein
MLYGVKVIKVYVNLGRCGEKTAFMSSVFWDVES